MTDDALQQYVESRERTLLRIQTMLIERLRVPFEPDQIDLDAPLFGTGLGLDSVDAVELIVAIEADFRLEISEGAAGPGAFRTVQSLVDLVLDPPPGVIPLDGDSGRVRKGA